MTAVTDREAVASVWVASWAGRSRPGDVADPDFDRRVGAWAQWALTRLAMTSGVSSRRYPAIMLPGVFVSTSGPAPKPHLEVPDRMLAVPDPGFPVRLAAAGNGLLFPWWLPAEAVALKRALFAAGPCDPSDPLAVLSASRAGLVDRVGALSSRLGRTWSGLEAALVADPGPVSELLTAGFSPDQVQALVPSLGMWEVRVVFDARLAADAGAWAARRVGIWTVHVSDGVSDVSFPVVTPRLTRRSLFADPLFAAERESVGSLLVRALMLARLSRGRLEPVPADPIPVAGFRAMPAVAGRALPEASVAAATAFVQAFADPQAAWLALHGWAQARTTPLVLTVSQDGFVAAFRACARAVRRAVSPSRPHINMMLPVAWEDGRVVRVTFNHADSR